MSSVSKFMKKALKITQVCTDFEGEIKEVELYTTKLSQGKQRTAVIKYDSGKNYIIREFSNGTLNVRKAVG